MLINDDFFPPLLRQVAGLDRMRSSSAYDPYPAYNIEKLGNGDYRISLAVPGLEDDDIDITLEGETLVVKGGSGETQETDGDTYLYRGIVENSFEKRFSIADHVEVKSADLQNGVLQINLHSKRVEKEEPRRIAIGSRKS